MALSDDFSGIIEILVDGPGRSYVPAVWGEASVGLELPCELLVGIIDSNTAPTASTRQGSNSYNNDDHDDNSCSNDDDGDDIDKQERRLWRQEVDALL